MRALARDRSTCSILIDNHLGVVWVSEALESLVGLPGGLIVGTAALGLVEDGDRAKVAAWLARSRDPLSVPSVLDAHLTPVIRLRREDGTAIHVRCRVTNLFDDPEVAGLLVHLDPYEVPHHRDAVIAGIAAGATETELIQSVLRLVRAQHPRGVPGIWTHGAPGLLETLPGASLPTTVASNLARLRPLRATYLVPEADPDGRGWWVVPARTNPTVDPAATVLVRCHAGVQPTVLVGDDLERTATLLGLALGRLEQEALLRRAAECDPLTGLANRRRFDAAVASVALAGHAWAVIYVDLDRFKPINDTFGHAAGDSVLQAVAGRLRRCVRPDDLVARIGGDEFAVLLATLGDGDVDTVAARINGVVEAPVAVAGSSVPVRCSIGIGVGLVGDDPEAVLALADRDLYATKASKRAVWG